MFGHSNSPTIGCDAVEFMCDGSVDIQQSTTNIIDNTVEETPLVKASKNGNLKEVRYLVEEAKANVDQPSNIWRKNRYLPIKGLALHAAVVAGQPQVVNYLIDYCKANINAKTMATIECDPDGGLTALHLAVTHLSDNAQKEIVTSLLARGADWTIVDGNGEQCWERTSNVELTKLFIELGVGMDSSRHPKSLNIAHKWSWDDQSAEIIAFAIDKDINISETDNEGLTPLMLAAAVRGLPNFEVAEVILNQTVQPISRFERINAFELMGATLISKGNFDGLQRIKRAMELRIHDPPIPKPPLTDDIKTAFNVTSEVQTMNELESIAHDLDLLQVQAHLIRLRILGIKHSETMYWLACHAERVCLTKPQAFFNYLHLILKGMESETETRFWDSFGIKLIYLSLFPITRSSDSMLPVTGSTFNNAMPILRNLVSFLNNVNVNQEDNFYIDIILRTIVNLTHVMLDGKPLTSQENSDLKCCLSQAVRLGKRTTEGLDLFLLACSKFESTIRDVVVWPEDVDGDIDGICFQRCGSVKTISIFIEVGCDVDSVTNEGDTGLHILAKNVSSSECMQSFERLYEADVHVHQKNLKGKTMIDILRERRMVCAFCGHFDASIIPACLLKPTRLKCLSARIVPQRQIPLLKQLPNNLSEFVTRHGKMKK